MMKIELSVGFVALTFLLLAVPALFAAQTQESTTEMNASVNEYVSITASANLTAGIVFPKSNPGIINVEASGNNGTSNTKLNIQVDSSTNDNIAFKDKASADLTSGGDTIVIGNVTNDVNTTIDGSNMNDGETTASKLATTYGPIGDDTNDPCGAVSPGSYCYMEYFLDIPTAQAPGDYTTTYYYCGETSTGTC